MHELAIAEDFLTVILDAAEDRPVKSAKLKIGRLHAVFPDSLRMSFQLAAEGTPAAQAVLDLQEVPASFRCKACGEITACGSSLLSCHACRSSDLYITAGDELEVNAIELENGVTVHPSASRQEFVHMHLHEHMFRDHRERQNPN